MNAAAHVRDASRWLPASAARPLHWWDPQALEAGAQSLHGVLRTWCEAWGWPGAVPDVRCRPGRPMAQWPGPWQAFERHGKPAAWAALPADTSSRMLKALFPEVTNFGPLSTAFAAACGNDALTRCAEALRVQRTAAAGAPPALERRWGAGAVEVWIGEPLGWCLLLAGTVAADWCGPRPEPRTSPPSPPLARIDTALAAHRLQVHVALDGCELELAALQALQPGDVLRLRHDIARPAALRSAAGSTLCHAYLGRRQGHMAVELATG